MSDRGCLHCTPLAAIVDHFPADPGVDATGAIEALAQVAGQILREIGDRHERLALTARFGAIVAAVSTGALSSAPAVRH